MRRRRGTESGAATIEFVIAAPGLLLVVALLIVGGRIAIANGAVEAAAADAARSASIARSAAQAQSDAIATANNSLNNQSLQCVGAPQITVNTGGFSVPVGQPATVSVTVTCDVQLSDLSIPGLPGSRRMSETVTSPLDTYRERG